MPLLPTAHFESASTLAVVMSSNEPLLFLSDDLSIIVASASFCRAFEIDPASVPGKRIGELGNGEWAMPRLASLLKATASGSASIDAYEIELKCQRRSKIRPRGGVKVGHLWRTHETAGRA